MDKVKTIITYSGLFIFFAVIGLIVYLNIKDDRQRGALEQATPQRATSQPTATTSPLAMGNPLTNALDAISSERMFSTLEALTSIQQHSGWRGGGTEGEKEAFDYIQRRLSELQWLTDIGMEIERESFNVFLSTEDHTTSVVFFAGDQPVEIPADTIRGPRDDVSLITKLDSDGILNDQDPNPVEVEGKIIVIPDEAELSVQKGNDQKSNILLVNYSLVDTINPSGVINARTIMGMNPGAVILVTQNSNIVGINHGSFVGDGGGVFQRIPWNNSFPLLFIEMENLAALNITDWDGMSSLTKAQVVWDVDVMNPGRSGNLIVHIPGKSKDKAILVSAHIDSPNSPGALDDGSGSTILMEIATVLNELEIQPEVDLYLAWYGSEELGLYGSTYFTTTHADLMNRLQANVQIDCLSHPMDGLPAQITLMFSHITGNSLATDNFVSYLMQRGKNLGFQPGTTFEPFASDNGSLSAFDIPNVNIIYESREMNEINGGVWVSGHFHDPYDTVELARDVEEAFVNMARLAMTAALISPEQMDFVNHSEERKVVFLANHTESPHMTPAGFPKFTQALMNAGYQISIVPFGQQLTADHLSNADMAIVLPVYDYSPENGAYNTGWSSEEAEILDAYVKSGGRILIINSGYRLKLYNRVLEENEDWSALNALTNQWGVNFINRGSENNPLNVEDRGLLEGASTINITPMNAVSFSIESGKTLAGTQADTYVAQVEVGSGEVVILGDLSILGEDDQGLVNPVFVKNLTEWK